MLDKIDINTLVEVDYNPRKISKKALKKLQASIRDHTESLEDWDPSKGFRLASTITVNRQGNRVIGGNQRLGAIKELGQTWIHASDITWVDLEPESAKEKALCVSLNNDHAAGRWDQNKLNVVIHDIQNDIEELYSSLDFSDFQKAIESENNSTEAEDRLAEIREQEVLLRDNAAFVVQDILDKFGDTVSQGFLFFAYKDRMHLIVQCDERNYHLVKTVAEGLKRENRAINDFVAGAFSAAVESELWDDLQDAVDKRGYVPVAPSDLSDMELQ